MADIVKYEGPKKESALKKLARQTKLHRVRLVYRTLLIVAAIAIVCVILYQNDQNREYTGYEVTSFSPRDAIPGTVHKRLGHSILVYSKDGAHGIDASGQKLWDVTFELQDPRAAVSGGCGVLYDENGRSLYLVGEREVLGQINTTLPIRGAAIAENGIVAALELDGETTWINLYNPQGEQLVGFKTSMSVSGYPLAIALSPKATLFAVSFLYADRGEFKTSVSFYNFGSVGQNFADRYVAGYDYVGQVVPVVGFLNDETAYAVSDSRLMFYAGKEIPVSQAEVFLQERVLSAYAGEGLVNLVFGDSTGKARYRVDTYELSGALRCSFPLDLDYTDIATGDGSVMAYNSTECEVWSLSGIHKLSTAFNGPVMLAIPGGGYRYTLVTSRGIENIRLN